MRCARPDAFPDLPPTRRASHEQALELLTIEVKPNLMGIVNAEQIQQELTRQGQLGWELVNAISLVSAPPFTTTVLLFKKEA